MDLGKIAVLDTSTARNIKWAACGNDAEEVSASPRLLELLADGYTVYIASTRTKLSPDTYDKCLFDLLPEENFFTANPEMETGHAKAEGLIDLWERVLTKLNIDLPPENATSFHSWMDLRCHAKNRGITIR
jgi:hypothetical protein